jgi:hypothetical protein
MEALLTFTFKDFIAFMIPLLLADLSSIEDVNVRRFGEVFISLACFDNRWNS